MNFLWPSTDAKPGNGGADETSNSTFNLLSLPTTEAGSFYDQLNKEIEGLRAKVDSQLREMVEASRQDITVLETKLKEIQSSDTTSTTAQNKPNPYSPLNSADSNVTEPISNISRLMASRHRDDTLSPSEEARMIGIVKIGEMPECREDDENDENETDEDKLGSQDRILQTRTNPDSNGATHSTAGQPSRWSRNSGENPLVIDIDAMVGPTMKRLDSTKTDAIDKARRARLSPVYQDFPYKEDTDDAHGDSNSLEDIRNQPSLIDAYSEEIESIDDDSGIVDEGPSSEEEKVISLVSDITDPDSNTQEKDADLSKERGTMQRSGTDTANSKKKHGEKPSTKNIRVDTNPFNSDNTDEDDDKNGVSAEKPKVNSPFARMIAEMPWLGSIKKQKESQVAYTKAPVSPETPRRKKRRNKSRDPPIDKKKVPGNPFYANRFRGLLYKSNKEPKEQPEKNLEGNQEKDDPSERGFGRIENVRSQSLTPTAMSPKIFSSSGSARADSAPPIVSSISMARMQHSFAIEEEQVEPGDTGSSSSREQVSSPVVEDPGYAAPYRERSRSRSKSSKNYVSAGHHERLRTRSLDSTDRQHLDRNRLSQSCNVCIDEVNHYDSVKSRHHRNVNHTHSRESNNSMGSAKHQEPWDSHEMPRQTKDEGGRKVARAQNDDFIVPSRSTLSERRSASTSKSRAYDKVGERRNHSKTPDLAPYSHSIQSNESSLYGNKRQGGGRSVSTSKIRANNQGAEHQQSYEKTMDSVMQTYSKTMDALMQNPSLKSNDSQLREKERKGRRSVSTSKSRSEHQHIDRPKHSEVTDTVARSHSVHSNDSDLHERNLRGRRSVSVSKSRDDHQYPSTRRHSDNKHQVNREQSIEKIDSKNGQKPALGYHENEYHHYDLTQEDGSFKSLNKSHQDYQGDVHLEKSRGSHGYEIIHVHHDRDSYENDNRSSSARKSTRQTLSRSQRRNSRHSEYDEVVESQYDDRYHQDRARDSSSFEIAKAPDGPAEGSHYSEQILQNDVVSSREKNIGTEQQTKKDGHHKTERSDRYVEHSVRSQKESSERAIEGNDDGYNTEISAALVEWSPPKGSPAPTYTSGKVMSLSQPSPERLMRTRNVKLPPPLEPPKHFFQPTPIMRSKDKKSKSKKRTKDLSIEVETEKPPSFSTAIVPHVGSEVVATPKAKHTHESNMELVSIQKTLSNGQLVLLKEVQGKAIKDPYGDSGSYTGILMDELPHGKGTMHYSDGRSYSGEWRQGRWHGEGRATFVNGDIYVGQYERDRRHGKGRYEWADGRIYDGEFHRNQRHGYGSYTWPDGASYIGEFVDGQRHGQGCYRFNDGSVYKGEWLNGKYDGMGECVWSSGRKYHGEWRAGKAQGYGVEWRADGTVRHRGDWKNDRPLRKNRKEP